MLSVFLHRKRKIAKALEESRGAAKHAGDAFDVSRGALKHAGEALEQTKRIYGIRLLVRGLLWVSVYFIARGLLALDALSPLARTGVALLPIPFFAWWLWTWMRGISEMDELERRIELEALAFAFPVAVVLLMTLGLLDVARSLNPDDWGIRHIWLMMPLLYYAGLWRARRRYQ